MDSNFHEFWFAPVTWNILGYSLFCERREKWHVARFAKVSVEEIEEAFIYQTDLVNTKRTIPSRSVKSGGNIPRRFASWYISTTIHLPFGGLLYIRIWIWSNALYNSRGNQINIAQIFILQLLFTNQIKCWFLMRGENWSTRGKFSHGRVENQQTQYTYDTGCGNRTRATFV